MRHHNFTDVFGVFEAVEARFEPDRQRRHAEQLDDFDQDEGGDDANGQQADQRRIPQQQARHVHGSDQQMEEFAKNHDGKARLEGSAENDQTERYDSDEDAVEEQSGPESIVVVEDPRQRVSGEDGEQSEGKTKQEPAVEVERISQTGHGDDESYEEKNGRRDDYANEIGSGQGVERWGAAEKDGNEKEGDRGETLRDERQLAHGEGGGQGGAGRGEEKGLNGVEEDDEEDEEPEMAEETLEESRRGEEEEEADVGLAQDAVEEEEVEDGVRGDDQRRQGHHYEGKRKKKKG